MSDSTPRLKLPELAQMQELNAATLNEALAQLDAVIDLYLKDRFVNTPPSAPADGDAYLLGGSPTGAWSGRAYKIAHCLDGAWRFFTPFDGLRAVVASSGAFILYQGGAWTDVVPPLSGAETNLASAATCDIGAAGSLCVAVTGTTAITSFGSGAGLVRFLRFTGALTLTHHAISLILLGGASRVTAANDVGLYRSDASGNWREMFYVRAATNPGDAATKSGAETLTNKTLVAPALGAATGTSLALGGAVLGSDTLAVTGSVTISGNLSSSGGNVIAPAANFFRWSGGSLVASPSDGVIKLTNAANGDFSRLQFGGTTSGFPALKRSGNALHARRADDSDWSSFWVGSLIANYGIYLGNGGSQIQQSSDGVIRLLNGAATDFGRLQLGGTSSAFPAIKRNGAALNIRLADDSGDAAITAAGASFSGDVLPAADNARALGSSSLRWATVYAATGAINTSDAAAKTNIRAPAQAELAVARRLAECVRLFQFRDARQEKGEAARLHAGSLYQDVVAAFAAEGLDAHRYGMVCADDGGKGLRYDQLNQFVIAGLAQRLAALEAAHAAG